MSAQKQQAMREAAIAEFTEFGYDNASVDSIAARAQVSKRTLYNHFASKEELFRALVGEVGQRISVSAAIRYSTRVTLRTQILRFVREAQKVLAQPRTLRLMRAVLVEHIRHPERVEAILKDYWRREYGLTAWAQAACDDGHLHGDPRKIGRAIASIIRAHVFWPTLLGRLEPRSAQFKADLAEAIDMFLSYYGRAAGHPTAP